MKITADSWHCRVHQWWYLNKYGYDNGGHSNLCPYVRSVLFWAPLRAIFWNWITIARIPVNAISIPVLLFAIPKLLGYFSYNAKVGIWTVYLMGLIISGAVSVLFGIVYLFVPDGGNLARPIAKFLATAESLRVIKAYLRSAHDGVCPEISWK